MPAYRYLHLDVFTSTPFEGNQLAVFPEPQGLTTGLMQAITREMNFSECTFIFPREGPGDVRMRIFTPAEELPMAGHPTIGSTFALAIDGAIARGRDTLVFELGIGPTPVSMDWDDRGLAFAWMTQSLPDVQASLQDRIGLAAALGLSTPEIDSGPPPQVVSCGLPYLIVPLVSRQAVDRVQVDRRALVRCEAAAGLGEVPVLVFTTEGDETTYSRMLAPGLGVAEDPATGSAAGPLGCYLVQQRLVPGDAARAMLNLQGVAMKRPSRIHISIDSEGERITRVRVGGQSVLVGRGDIRV
jgi:trans-2,3-dihydro-3-hydroxyanthranilate isomerase